MPKKIEKFSITKLWLREKILPKITRPIGLVFLVPVISVIFYIPFIVVPEIPRYAEKYNRDHILSNLPDIISAMPALSGGIIITLWYIYRGKSVKSLNDFFLFSSASYGLYLLIFDYASYLQSTNIQDFATNINHLFFKICLLVSTLAKALITFIDCLNESHRETELKHRKINTEKSTENSSAGLSTELVKTEESYSKPEELIHYHKGCFIIIFLLAIAIAMVPLIFL